jgi:ubiquinone biosynthesis protein
MASALRPKHLGRYASLGALLVKHRGEITLPDGEPGGAPEAAEGTASTEDARQLVDDLEAMGPTFVKLGQLLSTRADLLPPVYLDALSRLQDDVAPFPFDQVEEIVEAEIGARISKAFLSFDHAPMASASLGQVHRAQLRDGRAVAVKVQRPGIRRQVVEDMEVIEELAAFVDDHTRTGDRLPTTASSSRSPSRTTPPPRCSPWTWSRAATWAGWAPWPRWSSTARCWPSSSSGPTSTRSWSTASSTPIPTRATCS